MKKHEYYAKIEMNWRIFEVIEMIGRLKDFISKGDNLTIIIIISAFVVLFMVLIIILILSNAKKKKYRHELETLRNRVYELKQHEVIKNYSSYDNLKNDQKLGMLVLRWKKEIEKLAREVDAQYSMLDVLEDAIDQNNYQYFASLKNTFISDIEDLEEKADRFKDEIVQYVDIATDNRKYINKYREMTSELKTIYNSNLEKYKENQSRVEAYFRNIETKFVECTQLVEASLYVEADNIASNIFKDIKVLQNYIHDAPKVNDRINNNLKPKFAKLKQLAANFSEDEFKLLKIDFYLQYEVNLDSLNKVFKEINDFKVDDFETRLNEIESFLNTYITRLESELERKQFIIKNLEKQNENIAKVEITAKNFISIFKIVEGSYNITNKEINSIEHLLINIEAIKTRIANLINQFNNHELSYDEIKEQLDKVTSDSLAISKELDHNLVIIDEIYKDEQTARAQITVMTEKINGTKKYIKYANFDDQDKYLQIIKQLNLELSQLYIMLSSFPIDIVKLTDEVKKLLNKVEKTTQDINSIIYKTLLTEFVIGYAYRYFDSEYQKDLLIAENLFYKKNYNKAYEKVMQILDNINPDNRKIVLDKYQAKFSELF